MRSSTAVRISCRTSPLSDSKLFLSDIKGIVSENVPYNAKMTLKDVGTGNGFCMKEMEPKLSEAIS